MRIDHAFPIPIVTLDLDKIDDVVMRVTPKQGRAVIFDGKYYHTAEQPKDNLRCIINFNVE